MQSTKNRISENNQKKDLKNIKRKSEFKEFIVDQNHPCVMAQTVFSMDKVDFRVYENFGSRLTARELLSDLKAYIAKYDFDSPDFFTFIATFEGRKNYSEEQFEDLLWKQLEFLHEADDQPWDPTVSSDPSNPNFSFSIGGKAFYLVGLHPNSSRKARQSPLPTIAFNLHWQFEKLREMGAYANVKGKIQERDYELQGSNNPMLEDFGAKSEARQYSGRKVKEEWNCPFHTGK
jgi:hypothetical protein